MRHGERDYQPCHERGFIGQSLELAPLTENGEEQAENRSVRAEFLRVCRSKETGEDHTEFDLQCRQVFRETIGVSG